MGSQFQGFVGGFCGNIELNITIDLMIEGALEHNMRNCCCIKIQAFTVFSEVNLELAIEYTVCNTM